MGYDICTLIKRVWQHAADAAPAAAGGQAVAGRPSRSLTLSAVTNMSTVQALRAFVSQRLAVAVEDIIDMFQRTITEYERELDRQRRLLGAEQLPGVKLTVNGETGVSQDIRSLIISAKIPTEQQDSSCRLDQEAPCIKEEPEELVQTGSVWMRQGMEGADIISQFTPVSVKTEDDEENPQQRQTEEQGEADAAQQIEAGAVGESCGGSEPAFDLDVAGFLKATSDGPLNYTCMRVIASSATTMFQWISVEGHEVKLELK
ncbi:hypothetical protein E3U43_007959 [Larimichthys crocea]|uniref:Uncharacterized protein n=1 Tax=Larimichthys crocea TaxID=215358 RepID=A0ACD3Q751_LARCR|nr:hypothetical protein E3U43_007959 [Larimichthys crocea]